MPGPGGCLLRAEDCLVWGVPGPGGCLVQGDVPGPGGCLLPGCARWRPPGKLLLRAVRILLECILVISYFSHFRKE